MSNASAGDRKCSPRLISITSPPARTTTIAPTQLRTVPYLNVAAPAAQVATAPPADAPRYVGTGGNHLPPRASVSCRACKVTPAPAFTLVAATARSSSRSVAITTSPDGVAPPVSDDCAPTTSVGCGERRHADTSSTLRGRNTPRAVPPG